MLEGRTFRLERRSRIRGIELSGVVELREDQVFETVTLTASQAVPLKLAYPFMHAWQPTVSAYAAGRDGEQALVASGPLTDEVATARSFVINTAVDWAAVYEPVSGQWAVSRLLESPKQAGAVSMIWNVPGSYRKYYLRVFNDATVPAGFQGTWRMVTAFGAGPQEGWEAAARKRAEALRTVAEADAVSAKPDQRK